MPAGLLLLAVMLLCQVGLAMAGSARSLHGGTDFRAFYGAGKMLTLHQSSALYDFARQADVQRQYVSANGRLIPFVYPAFAALLFAPFSVLPFSAAFVAFTVFNLCLLGLFGWWALGRLRVDDGPTRWIVVALLGCVVPFLMALLQGQLSFVLLGVFTLAHVLSRRGKGFAAGLLLSLALVKFQLALPILLLFLCWRKWKTVGGMVLGGAVVSGLSLLLVGVEGVRVYVDKTLHMAHATATNPEGVRAAYGVMFPSDMPNFHGMFFVLLRGSKIGILFTLVASLVLLVAAARRKGDVATALCVAMLVSYHLLPYDMTLIALPLVVAIAQQLGRRSDLTSFGEFVTSKDKYNRLLVLAVVALLLPCGAVLVACGAPWMFIVAIGAVLACLAHQNVARSYSPAV